MLPDIGWLFNLGQTFNSSLAWKKSEVFKINGDDDDIIIIIIIITNIYVPSR